MVPGRRGGRATDESEKQQIELQALHRPPLETDRIEGLKQHLRRCLRTAPPRGVKRLESGAHRRERLIDADPILDIDIGE